MCHHRASTGRVVVCRLDIAILANKGQGAIHRPRH